MDLNKYLRNKDLQDLKFDTVYTEQPIPDIVQINWKNILEPPPSNDSSLTYKELLFVAKKTLNRSQQDSEFVHKIDQDMDSGFINLLQEYNMEYPDKIIDEMYNIIEPILMNVKNLYNRARPLQLANFFGIEIDTIITDTIHTASYPSGHTVYASMVSRIIQKTSPSIPKQKLNNLVDQTALARILQGVHYPSDNAASIRFTNVLFKHLYPKLI
jgi:hypothetical protein